MNGGSGVVEVVTSFLVREGEVLLLKRSDRVGTYRGKWAGVSGYLEGDPPERRARIEIIEELGLGPGDVRLERIGEPVFLRDCELDRRWMVHPFRFALLGDRDLKMDWEHVEMRWISPVMFSSMDTVPGLFEAWRRVSEG